MKGIEGLRSSYDEGFITRRFRSAILSTYDPFVKFERPERKLLMPVNINPFRSGLALREKVLERKQVRFASFKKLPIELLVDALKKQFLSF